VRRTENTVEAIKKSDQQRQKKGDNNNKKSTWTNTEN